MLRTQSLFNQVWYRRTNSRNWFPRDGERAKTDAHHAAAGRRTGRGDGVQRSERGEDERIRDRRRRWIERDAERWSTPLQLYTLLCVQPSGIVISFNCYGNLFTVQSVRTEVGLSRPFRVRFARNWDPTKSAPSAAAPSHLSSVCHTVWSSSNETSLLFRWTCGPRRAVHYIRILVSVPTYVYYYYCHNYRIHFVRELAFVLTQFVSHRETYTDTRFCVSVVRHRSELSWAKETRYNTYFFSDHVANSNTNCTLTYAYNMCTFHTFQKHH
jgi:hypothetical protein